MFLYKSNFLYEHFVFLVRNVTYSGSIKYYIIYQMVYLELLFGYIFYVLWMVLSLLIAVISIVYVFIRNHKEYMMIIYFMITLAMFVCSFMMYFPYLCETMAALPMADANIVLTVSYENFTSMLNYWKMVIYGYTGFNIVMLLLALTKVHIGFIHFDFKEK